MAGRGIHAECQPVTARWLNSNVLCLPLQNSRFRGGRSMLWGLSPARCGRGLSTAGVRALCPRARGFPCVAPARERCGWTTAALGQACVEDQLALVSPGCGPRSPGGAAWPPVHPVGTGLPARATAPKVTKSGVRAGTLRPILC